MNRPSKCIHIYIYSDIYFWKIHCFSVYVQNFRWVLVDISHMVHSKCPSTEPGYCNDISSIKFTAFDLYLSVQSQDGRCTCRSCRRRLWWVFVVEPKYHRKRTWASTNFWDSTSSSQDCFILLIFILIAKLLCTHESSICIYIPQ